MGFSCQIFNQKQLSRPTPHQQDHVGFISLVNNCAPTLVVLSKHVSEGSGGIDLIEWDGIQSDLEPKWLRVAVVVVAAASAVVVVVVVVVVGVVGVGV